MFVKLKDGRSALTFTGRASTSLYLPSDYIWASIEGADFQIMRRSKIEVEKKKD